MVDSDNKNELGFLASLERRLAHQKEWKLTETEAHLLNMFTSMMSAYAARLGIGESSETESLQKVAEYADTLSQSKFG